MATFLAARIALFKPSLVFGSKASPSAPSQARIAANSSFRCASCILEPATSEATFCSSLTFQLMYSSTSGWSASTITILAARRVVPPDLIAPAARSPIFKNPIKPEDLPPPDSFSSAARRLEKLVPVPDPYLNRRASRTQRSIMPPSPTRSSPTDWMKQAWG